jgi:hypothetical protein
VISSIRPKTPKVFEFFIETTKNPTPGSLGYGLEAWVLSTGKLASIRPHLLCLRHPDSNSYRGHPAMCKIRPGNTKNR